MAATRKIGDSREAELLTYISFQLDKVISALGYIGSNTTSTTTTV